MNAQLKEQSTEITEFREFDRRMQEFRDQYDGVVYDLTDPAQDKRARSDRYAIGKVISALDQCHKEIKAPLKARVDLIDGERKRIKDELLDIQNKIKSQIGAHEKAIQERLDALVSRVEAIRALAVFGEYETPTAAQISARLEQVQAIDIEDGFEEMKAEAALAQTESVKRLQSMLAERQKYEAEQAELERLRKEKEARERAEREEQIRKEAAEKARREAEQESDRKLQAAEEEKQRAVKAERERIEREQREAAAKAEAERKAEEARKAKQAHRAKIHGEAKQSFIDAGMEESAATLAVELIKDSKIAHVRIEY